MTVTILCVEKSGSIKEIELKTYNEAELYKKAGFKTAQDFELQTEWGALVDDKTYSVSVFGKTSGRAGQENKYDFPPPIDTILFFGSCILVNKVDDEPENLSKTEWKKIYEHLFGGFEDLGDEDSDESEDDISESAPRTKEGYVKDGFIVDDDDEDDDYSDDSGEESTSEEEVVVVKKKATKTPAGKNKPATTAAPAPAPSPAGKKAASKKKAEQNVFTRATEEADTYLDCTSELSEEEYV